VNNEKYLRVENQIRQK